VQILRRGGTYVNPGLAVPADPIPVELYSAVVNKDLTIRGVWAGDSSHLGKSIELVQSGNYPFDKLVTHRFKLEDHEEAWRVLTSKEGVKLVFEP
jgi:threonine dehydrogenase-like Zn-dependent dehydrogenase